MRKVKWYSTYTQTNELSYLPTSTRDVYQLLSSHGIKANLIKFGGQYDLIYPRSDDEKPIIVSTGLNTLDGMTIKGWIEFATKHKPEYSILGEKGILWEAMLERVQKSTI